MPTDMKNTAPNRSLTGVMRRSMRSASTVPASIDPITKAPRASEKPDFTENTAMKKHSAMEMTSISSSLMTLRKRLNTDGIRNMPTVNQIIRKPERVSTLFISSSPCTFFLATDDSITSSTTAKRSSTMSTASTRGTKRRWRILRSSRALMMMVVDDIDSMPPRNMALTALKFSSRPTTKPSPIMPSTIISAVTAAEPPTLSSFLKLKSSPIENRSTMMPICAQKSMLPSCTTDGKKAKCGLAMKPATM